MLHTDDLSSGRDDARTALEAILEILHDHDLGIMKRSPADCWKCAIAEIAAGVLAGENGL